MLKQTDRKSASTYKTGFASPATLDRNLMLASQLTNGDTTEILEFLDVRPVHAVVMASLINDNGVESEFNRGKFYGYRDSDGSLEGVALIGHSTLVESRSEDALRALALHARFSETPIHLIMSSGTVAKRFWDHLSGGAAAPRATRIESLFEIAFPFQVQSSRLKIERAAMEDLLPVAEAQAEIAFDESGVDPLARDREGFIKRVARRIEQGRVFAAFEDDIMIFKADVIAETENVAYLEGLWVSPEYRGRNIGSVCLSMLALELIERVENICLLSSVGSADAHKTFVKAGFRNTDECTIVFV